jgi:hypothetical protein
MYSAHYSCSPVTPTRPRMPTEDINYSGLMYVSALFRFFKNLYSDITSALNPQSSPIASPSQMLPVGTQESLLTPSRRSPSQTIVSDDETPIGSFHFEPIAADQPAGPSVRRSQRDGKRKGKSKDE